MCASAEEGCPFVWCSLLSQSLFFCLFEFYLLLLLLLLPILPTLPLLLLFLVSPSLPVDRFHDVRDLCKKAASPVISS